MLVDAREGWRLGFGGRVNDFWMRISKGAVCTRGDELSGEKYVSPPVMICLAGVIAVGHGWDGTRRQFPYFEHREGRRLRFGGRLDVIWMRAARAWHVTHAEWISSMGLGRGGLRAIRHRRSGVVGGVGPTRRAWAVGHCG